MGQGAAPCAVCWWRVQYLQHLWWCSLDDSVMSHSTTIVQNYGGELGIASLSVDCVFAPVEEQH